MKLIVVTVLSFSFLAGFCQTPTAELPKVVGPSPNQAAIQKYGDYKVATYTGVPGIDIPLYTINARDLTVPISISYNASGIKVSEEASRIGLGWSLNAGGSISRSVQGLDDLAMHSLHPYSFDLVGFPQKYVIASHTLSFGAHTYDITNKLGGPGVDPAYPGLWADFEPDIFYYNFLGNSGKFLLKKQDTTAIFEDPSTNMKVKLFITRTPSEPVDSCKILITSSDGTMYYFDAFEICTTEGPTTVPSRITAWYLTKIQSVKGTIVSFHYTHQNTGTTYTLNTPSDFVYVWDAQGLDTSRKRTTIPHNKYSNVLLSSISFPTGVVSFNYGSRVDIQGDKRLTSMIVKNYDSLTVKKIDFVQDYFTANASGNNTIDLMPALWGGSSLDSNWIKKRLKLTELRETSADSQIVLAHKFYYNETLLPLKNSTSRDHWGYFNNAPNGDRMIPSLIWAYPGLTKYSIPPQWECPNPIGSFDQNALYAENPHKVYKNYEGSNREVDTTHCKAFALNKITYPTGGSTAFTFESNTYDRKKSFADDKNAELYNYEINTQNLVFLTGVSYMPGGTLQTFNFSITGSDTLPGEGAALVKMKFTALKSSPAVTNSNMTWLRLKTAGGTLIEEIGFNEFSDLNDEGGNNYSLELFERRLTIGDYKIEILLSGNTVDKSCIIYSIYAKWFKVADQDPDGIKYKYGSGLRVKNITSYTADSAIASSTDYIYHFTADSNQNSITEVYTTGKLMDRPRYLDYFVGYLSQSTVKIKSEASVSGSVGYDSVIIKQNNIKRLEAYYNNPYRPIRYKLYYTSPAYEMMPGFWKFPYQTIYGIGLPGDELHSDIFFDYKPPGFKDFTDNANGKLKKTVDYVYDSSSGNHRIVRQIETQYTGEGTGISGIIWADRISTFFSSIDANISNESGYPIGSCLGGLPVLYGATSYFYPAMRSMAVLPTSQVEKIYEGNDSLVTTTTFAYNGLRLLQKSVQDNSLGEIVTTNLKYPMDYTITGTPNNTIASAIKNLQSKNIVTPVIEQYTQRSLPNGSNLRTISSQLASYKSSIPLPDTVFNGEIIDPLTDFTPASIAASSSSIDSRYASQVVFRSYDTAGNILEMQKADNVVYSFLWDYRMSYPIAEVSNASQASIAYTSFEADGSGNWTIGSSARISNDAVTGTRCYQLSNGNVSKSGLNVSNSYIVSYWSKNGQQTVAGGSSVIVGKTVGLWTYYEHIVPNPSGGIITVSGSGVVDELRLHPKGALMTTYTYTPLIGRVSQCDASNRITYYEYDGFGRLSLIRDDDKNILKKFRYSYLENAVPTVYYNIEKSGTFTRNNCTGGASGSSVTYTVAADTYSSDISPEAADQLAQDDVDANGQNYANANGTCTYWNDEQSGNFTPNNCSSGYTGSSIAYTVAPNTYSSAVSPAAANQLAVNDVNANGQNYANTNGTCAAAGSFTMNPGWTKVSGSITAYMPAGGTTHSASYFIVFFYTTGAPNWNIGVSNTIATISTQCRPSTNKVQNFSSNGCTWEVTITSGGSVMVKRTGGASPPSNQSVIAFSLGSYNW